MNNFHVILPQQHSRIWIPWPLLCCLWISKLPLVLYCYKWCCSHYLCTYLLVLLQEYCSRLGYLKWNCWIKGCAHLDSVLPNPKGWINFILNLFCICVWQWFLPCMAFLNSENELCEGIAWLRKVKDLLKSPCFHHYFENGEAMTPKDNDLCKAVVNESEFRPEPASSDYKV